MGQGFVGMFGVLPQGVYSPSQNQTGTAYARNRKQAQGAVFFGVGHSRAAECMERYRDIATRQVESMWGDWHVGTGVG